MSATPAADRDVQFDADGTTTYGTLHVPAHRDGERLAAALLLAGSGPTDRDGNVPGLEVMPQTLKLIAAALGQLGVMSLRFDKYFSGRTGGGAFAGDPAALDLGAYLRQAAAAYQAWPAGGAAAAQGGRRPEPGGPPDGCRAAGRRGRPAPRHGR